MSKPEFVYITYIETTPEKLWQALTSAEVQPEIFFRQCGRGRTEGRWRLHRAHARRRLPYQRRGDRMRSLAAN